MKQPLNSKKVKWQWEVASAILILSVLVTSSSPLSARDRMPDSAEQSVRPESQTATATPKMTDCDCGSSWGDLNDDGNINPIDVVFLRNYVFWDIDARIQPSNCPLEAGDVTCDGYVDPLDVMYIIGYVYKGQPIICSDPCP